MSLSIDDMPRSLRRFIRFPVEVAPPEGFDPDRLETWPKEPGRFEYVGGRLLYMPPCGEPQATVVAGVVHELMSWTDQHTDKRVGTNEVGMMLGRDRRGADAAVWPREGPVREGFASSPPILAVEVAGRDEGERELRRKAVWYIEHGVRVVWIVLPDTREVLVIGPETESRHRSGDRLPANPYLPGLEPEVASFFRQLD